MSTSSPTPFSTSERPSGVRLQAIDTDDLLRRVDNDIALAAELLNEFIVMSSRSRAALREQLVASEPGRMAKEAHRLLGALLTVGAVAAGAAARELEVRALGSPSDEELGDAVKKLFETLDEAERAASMFAASMSAAEQESKEAVAR